MKKIVDARGLSCPQPVILTKKAMDEGVQVITTIVNQVAARENVSKLATSQGYGYEVEQRGDEFYINMTRSDGAELPGQAADDVAVLVKSSLFGDGEEGLGQVLMKSFLYTLNETEGIQQVIFMNSGIYLTLNDSPVLEYLMALEEKGVEILSCGTCLDYYNKKEQLAVGKVTNMFTAVEILSKAAHTITV